VKTRTGLVQEGRVAVPGLRGVCSRFDGPWSRAESCLAAGTLCGILMAGSRKFSHRVGMVAMRPFVLW